jgi:glycosyltransferase involved in cell wall biosynthesis
MLNVLFIDHVSTKKFGGAERVLDTLVSNLDKDKFGCTLILGKNTGDDLESQWQCAAQANIIGVKLREFSKGNKTLDLLAFIADWSKVALKIRSAVRGHNIDLVVSNTIIGAIYAAPVSWLLRLRHIYYEHNINDQRSGSLLAYAIKPICFFSDKVICISDVVLASLVGIGIPKDKLVVVHNCFDFLPLQNAFRGQMRKADPKIVDLGMVANFMPWKNHEKFVDVVDALAKELTGFRVRGHLVGSCLPGQEQYYLRVSQKLDAYSGLAQFTLHGFSDNAQSLIAGFDVMIHTAEEPFGLVYLEAMYLNTLVVASNRGAAPEIITNGETGLLVDYSNLQETVALIKQVILNKQLCNKLETRAKMVVESRFSIRRYIRDIERVLLG